MTSFLFFLYFYLLSSLAWSFVSLTAVSKCWMEFHFCAWLFFAETLGLVTGTLGSMLPRWSPWGLPRVYLGWRLSRLLTIVMFRMCFTPLSSTRDVPCMYTNGFSNVGRRFTRYETNFRKYCCCAPFLRATSNRIVARFQYTGFLAWFPPSFRGEFASQDCRDEEGLFRATLENKQRTQVG